MNEKFPRKGALIKAMFLVENILKLKNQFVLKTVLLYELTLSNIYSLTVHFGTSES